MAEVMLRKVPSRRPFIDSIIEMFPKPYYSLANEIDIENYKICKSTKREIIPYDRKERKLELDFQALKRELLNPDQKNLLLSNILKLPTIKLNKRRSNTNNKTIVKQIKGEESTRNKYQKIINKSSTECNLSLLKQRPQKLNDVLILKANNCIDLGKHSKLLCKVENRLNTTLKAINVRFEREQMNVNKIRLHVKSSMMNNYNY